MSSRAWMVGRVVAVVVSVGLIIAAVAVAASGLTVVTSPNPPAANVLDGRVAPSPGQVWAIGKSTSPSYAGCHVRTLAGRWNGSGFAEVQFPPVAIVAPADTTYVYASGTSAESTLIEHLKS